MGKREGLSYQGSPCVTPEASATLFGSLANRGGRIRLASERRIDVPENAGGPASCGNAERPGPHYGLRPSATPIGAGAPPSREDLSPGTRETDNSAGVDAERIARGVTHAGAAETTETMHEGECRP